MNITLLALCLLLSTISVNGHDRCGTKRIKIDHKLISVMDGTPRTDIVKMLKLEEDLAKMQTGDGQNGLFTYEGKKVTINQLVEIEKTHKARLPKALKEMLHEAIAHYEKITHDYLKEARGFKEQMVKLIKKWAEQRKIHKSILIEWGNQGEGQELEQLKKLAQTFEDLNGLLSDLSCFLKDLRYSCTKSWNIVKNQKG